MGLRNRLIHGYFAIDTAIVWEILQKDMPELKKNLLENFYSDIENLINS
ncbi:HepT-like ribonuclease domain-containing protein [Sulfurihydrogenibium sp.]